MNRLTLTIRPEPKGRDRLGRAPDTRLKALLKRMLRDFGWRCERIEIGHEARSVAPDGANRPPTFARAASVDARPTLDPSEESTRQNGSTAAGDSQLTGDNR